MTQDYVPSQRRPLRDTWLQTIDMGKQNMLSKEQILNIDNEIHEGKEAELIVCRYVDFLLTTWNPCSPYDGWSKPEIHQCQKSYLSLKANEMADDYVHLLNLVERQQIAIFKLFTLVWN